jgi:hypothetical protein
LAESKSAKINRLNGIQRQMQKITAGEYTPAAFTKSVKSVEVKENKLAPGGSIAAANAPDYRLIAAKGGYESPICPHEREWPGEGSVPA